MKGLILAGGLGTRLRPLSHTGPKQLVPVGNKPVLFYGIEDLANAGIKDIGIIVGYTHERIEHIKSAVGDGSRWNVNITYIEQDAPRGLAHAVWIARDFLGNEPFVVYLGDNILKYGIRQFVDEFRASSYNASLLLCEVDDPRIYGTAILDSEMNVIDVEEKPTEPKSNYVIVGVYLFTQVIFDFIKNVKPGKNGELQLTDAIKDMVHSGNHKVRAYKVEGWWDDTGTAEAVLRANHLVLMDLKNDIKGKIEEGVKLIGNIQIGERTVVCRGSTIKGPTIVGKNCRIGPNTYIGPYTSIGDYVEIDGAEIEASIILDHAKINIKERIVDSLIGKHVRLLSEKSMPSGIRYIIGENSEIRF